MTPGDFKIACISLEDCNRLIAAGKIQRWGVVKWAVTTNLALATASILLRAAHAGGLFAFFSILVAAAGGGLVYHYNRRMTGARANATGIQTYLSNNKVNLSAISGTAECRSGDAEPCGVRRRRTIYLHVHYRRIGVAFLLCLVSPVTQPARCRPR